MNDDLEDLKRQIRAWANRPTSRSPAAARTRILARLGERRVGGGWRLAAATAVVALALASGLWLLRSPAPPMSEAGGLSAVAAAEPPAGLLIYQLRSGTKLYLDLAGSRPANGPVAETAFQR